MLLPCPTESFYYGSYIHVFIVDYSALENIYGVFTLEKIHSYVLITRWLSIVPHLRVEPCEIFSIHIGIPSDGIAMQILFYQPIAEVLWTQLPSHILKALACNSCHGPLAFILFVAPCKVKGILVLGFWYAVFSNMYLYLYLYHLYIYIYIIYI